MHFLTLIISLSLLITTGTTSTCYGQANECHWEDRVLEKLLTVFKDEKDADDLNRVLIYLTADEWAYRNSSKIPPTWRILKTTLSSDTAFEKYAKFLVEDSKKGEKGEAFQKTLNRMYSLMLEGSGKTWSEDTFQGFDTARLTGVREVLIFMGFSKGWGNIATQHQERIRELIPATVRLVIGDHKFFFALDNLASLVEKTSGNAVTITLAGVYLSYDAYNNLGRWLRGEISGKRCCKNIIDSTCTVGAGIAGGFGGAAVGSSFGPVGTVIGAVVGTTVSAQATNYLVDRLTQSLFGIPKNESLENAYNYIGVSMTASNDEINTAFRDLCIKHDPQSGGKPEDFHLVQIHMAVIKLARGEGY